MKYGMAIFVGVAALVLGSAQRTMADPVPLEAVDGGQPVSGDSAQGKKLFPRCGVCHSTDAGVNKIGPSLHGIIGRTAGTVPNFNYSNANKTSGIVWTEQKIYDYLKNPQATIPGTKMAFPGLPKGQDRADLLAYLKDATK